MPDELEIPRLLKEIEDLKRTRDVHGPVAVQATRALNRGDLTTAHELMKRLRTAPLIDPAS